MPFASREKRNEYQREYKRKVAAELKKLRDNVSCVQKDGDKHGQ
jgi:hypothetical protein